MLNLILIPILLTGVMFADEDRKAIDAWISFSEASQNLGLTTSRAQGAIDPDFFDDALVKVNKSLEMLVAAGEFSKKTIEVKFPKGLDSAIEELAILSEFIGKYGVYSSQEMTGFGKFFRHEPEK